MLERWLKKYETVYPKGPILGYCAGQPVFRRSCVQTLHTSDRWLREGRKVKPGELPAKVWDTSIFLASLVQVLDRYSPNWVSCFEWVRWGLLFNNPIE